jgi:hypothetical protein
MGPPTRKGWYVCHSSQAPHVACDVTVGHRIPEAFLEVDSFTIHFRRGMKCNTDWDSTTHALARFLGFEIFQSHAFNMTVQPQSI